ncbi:BnaA08g13150D [Brassica napus]|uniref:BnaA08g13150D protein n=1 Tax=Brassica napus TaxID=3708 RepID=A0A078FMT5_BRANA|nr:BnaA08g13150D [Brassica napus]
MSVEEKRQLVYELSKQSSHLAPEVLQAWSRQEILQILCAEMGKERKYTGLTKVKIIETLMKIVSEKNAGECDENKKKRDSDCCLPVQRSAKRPRKKTTYCKNLACRAVMRQEDAFCRRCSCCICRKYDENKDPSLWLTCSSDPPFEGGSCGSSCHLECAFESEKSGLAKRSEECCFYCVSCGKPNSLLECWKKQLTIAKEARRVDILCYRLLLVQKLVKGSSKYRNVCEAVEKAVKCLEADVGPLTMKMGRGIVNRLNSGPDVQKLCSSALESLQTLETKPPEISADTATTVPPTKIRFEDVNATSLTVILASNEVDSPANIVHYSIWHRKVTEKEYQEKSTCTLFTPNARFVVSGLAPASEYCFKVVSFSGTRELGVDVINVVTRSPEERSESPLTNCNNGNNGDHHSANGGAESGLEHCVKIIRQLECSGHIEKDFRQKFLTWYSLRATPQESRVVKIFIDTFTDDPVALAEQLVHTFSDRVSVKRSAIGGGASAVVQSGFCMKLWH